MSQKNTIKPRRQFFERRGTMVYTEESAPGKACFVYEAGTEERAQEIVDALNTYVA